MSEILPSVGDIIYEVDFDADAAIEERFDTWLRDHIADVLQFPGFRSAEILSVSAGPDERVRRTVQYRLRDRKSLDDYLADHAPRLEAQGAALLDGRFDARPRVLTHREEFIHGAVSTENCLNCGEVLTGQHCSHCGQRARVRVLSLWGMTRDLLGDLLDWDARIWRTLRPLAFSPGRLTQDYLRGRRASYTPPFRMYVLLSVAFFVVATSGSDPGSALQFKLDDEGGASLQISGDDGKPAPASESAPAAGDAGPAAQPGTASERPAPAAGQAAETAPPALDEETTRLIEMFVERMPEEDRAQARVDLTRRMAEVPAAELDKVKGLMQDPCSEDNFKVETPWGREYEPRLRQACRKIWSDTPSYGRALFENVPKMMFIFLPLIAAVLYLLYLGSGRYYVEHLLFIVHFHAFFFLGGLSILLVERSAWLAPGTAFATVVAAVGNFITAVFTFYVPVYLFIAMRRVYGQGRFVTFVKYSTLGIAYLVGLLFTALGLLLYTALTL